MVYRVDSVVTLQHSVIYHYYACAMHAMCLSYASPTICYDHSTEKDNRLQLRYTTLPFVIILYLLQVLNRGSL